MKYAVISPKNKLICFDHSGQVAEYCLEKDNDALNEYCGERGYQYEDMTPTEIGQLYTEIGAVYGGCRIFETADIISSMRENQVDIELIERAENLFNDRIVNEEIDCPGYIEDFVIELTPISATNLTEGVYFMENVDAPSDVADRG